ncbi:putative JmjC domain-containing histone demethylation protein 2C [Quaeritorhiza haematococci]|nr:putative JmjC domain-containing histone demethylation protein 2C [Quaeritorhiza haematococci]
MRSDFRPRSVSEGGGSAQQKKRRAVSKKAEPATEHSSPLLMATGSDALPPPSTQSQLQPSRTDHGTSSQPQSSMPSGSPFMTSGEAVVDPPQTDAGRDAVLSGLELLSRTASIMSDHEEGRDSVALGTSPSIKHSSPHQQYYSPNPPYSQPQPNSPFTHHDSRLHSPTLHSTTPPSATEVPKRSFSQAFGSQPLGGDASPCLSRRALQHLRRAFHVYQDVPSMETMQWIARITAQPVYAIQGWFEDATRALRGGLYEFHDRDDHLMTAVFDQPNSRRPPAGDAAGTVVGGGDFIGAADAMEASPYMPAGSPYDFAQNIDLAHRSTGYHPASSYRHPPRAESVQPLLPRAESWPPPDYAEFSNHTYQFSSLPPSQSLNPSYSRAPPPHSLSDSLSGEPLARYAIPHHTATDLPPQHQPSPLLGSAYEGSAPTSGHRSPMMVDGQPHPVAVYEDVRPHLNTAYEDVQPQPIAASEEVHPLPEPTLPLSQTIPDLERVNSDGSAKGKRNKSPTRPTSNKSRASPSTPTSTGTKRKRGRSSPNDKKGGTAGQTASPTAAISGSFALNGAHQALAAATSDVKRQEDGTRTPTPITSTASNGEAKKDKSDLASGEPSTTEYTPIVSAKKGKGAGRKQMMTKKPAVTPDDAIVPRTLPENAKIHIQSKQCMVSIYAVHERCRSCIRKNGDICRFKNFRAFLENDAGTLEYGPYFVAGCKSDWENAEEPPPWACGGRGNKKPTWYNAAGTISTGATSEAERRRRANPIATSLENEKYILDVISPAFASLLTEELTFVNTHNPSFFRPPPAGARQLCDSCLTSIFNVYWICCVCGMEICRDCYDEWDDGTPASIRPDGSTAMNPPGTGNGVISNSYHLGKIFACSYKRNHFKKQLVSAHRIPHDGLKRVVAVLKDQRYIKEMEDGTLAAVNKSGAPIKDGAACIAQARAERLEGGLGGIMVSDILNGGTVVQFPNPLARRKNQQPWTPLPPESPLPFDSMADSRNYLRVDAEHLTLTEFRARWQRGEVVVITNLRNRVMEEWSPEYFIDKHGDEVVPMVDCRDGSTIDGLSVKTFFEGFLDKNKRPRDRKTGLPMILKLKDWPSNSDFKEKFPRHYEDFTRSVPFRDYHHRGGPLNLAARLPSDQVPPDLGPKMYNAYGGVDIIEPGVGTTPLHLDMADAVNMMVYATGGSVERDELRAANGGSTDVIIQKTSDGSILKRPQRVAAAWDIYAYDDLPVLRTFLRKIIHEQNQGVDDPIHDQRIYLNAALRERLYRETGIRGWRVHQNVGDAVFVPAGSAHQVCNYTESVKVAIDFLSPENMRECLELTKEFRLLGFGHRRKEDLLQLKTIAWHAWRECYTNLYPDGLTDVPQSVIDELSEYKRPVATTPSTGTPATGVRKSKVISRKPSRQTPNINAKSKEEGNSGAHSDKPMEGVEPSQAENARGDSAPSGSDPTPAVARLHDFVHLLTNVAPSYLPSGPDGVCAREQTNAPPGTVQPQPEKPSTTTSTATAKTSQPSPSSPTVTGIEESGHVDSAPTTNS